MSQYRSVIQLARQSAVKKFSVLVQRMAQNSDQELARALSVNSPLTDYNALNAARNFLRLAGDELLRTMEAEYQQKLEQALHVLFSEERIETSPIKADDLTLIDDRTINRQIEVGHMAGRLCASCSENLGLVNVIISQLLEKNEVREKDNPFRPELIANTLHEVLSKMVEHENVRRFLLNYSINSLSLYLSEYYFELCEVFRSGGISPKLLTRPTSMNPYRSGPQNRPTSERRSARKTDEPEAAGGDRRVAAAPPGASLPAEMLPTLQRILSALQRQTGPSVQAQSGTSRPDPVNMNSLVAFQSLVNTIFNDQNAGAAQAGGNLGSAGLLARLNEFQHMAANGHSVDGSVTPSANQLFAIGARLDGTTGSNSERMALDLMTVLFEIIGRDEQIPQALRDQLGRLQIPFLKSALLDPDTLQQVDHPSRQLLNHMGMVSVGLPAETAYGQEVVSEIRRIVKTILTDFRDDTGIFASSLEELKKFMRGELRRTDAQTGSYIEILEGLQQIRCLTDTITASVRALLIPLHLDPRVVDFCLNIWVHVLVKASRKISKAQGDHAESKRTRLHLFFDALPELIWSAQKKNAAEDRLELIRLLPKLVKILKSGMIALHMPEAEVEQTLDTLFSVHAQVMGSSDQEGIKDLPTLDALRRMFTLAALETEATTSRAVAPLPLDSAAISGALAKKGMEATLYISAPDGYSTDIEHEWLAEMQVGTRVEYKIDGAYQIGRLIWVCPDESLYMFRLDANPTPLIYCPVSLSRALRNGTMTFVENPATFERAVETLLQDADLLKNLTDL